MDYQQLKPLPKFCEEASAQLLVKAASVRALVLRNLDELVDKKAVFKTRGKAYLVDPEAFMRWYLSH